MGEMVTFARFNRNFGLYRKHCERGKGEIGVIKNTLG